jgi:hypothetical protein
MDWNWQVNRLLAQTDPTLEPWVREATGLAAAPLRSGEDAGAMLLVPWMPGMPAPLPPNHGEHRAMWLHPQGAPPPQSLVVAVGASSFGADDSATLDLAAWLTRTGKLAWGDLIQLDGAGDPLEPFWGDCGRALLLPWRLATAAKGSRFWSRWPGPVVLCAGRSTALSTVPAAANRRSYSLLAEAGGGAVSARLAALAAGVLALLVAGPAAAHSSEPAGPLPPPPGPATPRLPGPNPLPEVAGPAGIPQTSEDAGPPRRDAEPRREQPPPRAKADGEPSSDQNAAIDAAPRWRRLPPIEVPGGLF